MESFEVEARLRGSDALMLALLMARSQCYLEVQDTGCNWLYVGL